MPSISPGNGYIDIDITNINLLPARYMLMLGVTGGADDAALDGDVRAYLDVEPSGAYGTARVLNSRFGILYFRQKWRLPTSSPAAKITVPN